MFRPLWGHPQVLSCVPHVMEHKLIYYSCVDGKFVLLVILTQQDVNIKNKNRTP
jgi:hypothetical protein